MVQLSSFAFLVKNLVRQRGLQRIAGKVHLTGTGMALPWRLFDQADLARAMRRANRADLKRLKEILEARA